MSDRSTPARRTMGAGNAGATGLCVAVLLSAALASPAMAASTTGHVSVTILPAAAVTENTPISFVGAGATSAGVLSLVGAPHTAVTLSVGPGDRLAHPGTAISVGAFAHNAGLSPSLNGAGVLNVAVGATVAVASSQPAGSYSGTYTVIVNY